MLSILEAILLGIVQGISEWLPISSSGHLVLAQYFFGIDMPLIFDVLLHFGTLIAVVAAFWSDIVDLVSHFFTRGFKEQKGKMILYLIVASIPTAIIGIALRNVFAALFNTPRAVCYALIVTGLFLLHTKNSFEKKEFTFKNTFFIGCAQALAIIPGISRSGATIATALHLGIEKKDAARFSFLLALPAIFGATLFELQHITTLSGNYGAVALAVCVSAGVGYATIKWLLTLITKGKFFYFGYYCIGIGLLALFLV